MQSVSDSQSRKTVEVQTESAPFPTIPKESKEKDAKNVAITYAASKTAHIVGESSNFVRKSGFKYINEDLDGKTCKHTCKDVKKPLRELETVEEVKSSSERTGMSSLFGDFHFDFGMSFSPLPDGFWIDPNFLSDVSILPKTPAQDLASGSRNGQLLLDAYKAWCEHKKYMHVYKMLLNSVFEKFVFKNGTLLKGSAQVKISDVEKKSEVQKSVEVDQGQKRQMKVNFSPSDLSTISTKGIPDLIHLLLNSHGLDVLKRYDVILRMGPQPTCYLIMEGLPYGLVIARTVISSQFPAVTFHYI
ncbi:OLC1v1005626C1 [Oldenlandia corymbosa var. corymbosa]|uniref:OLC1v1005626C1 n=1 Tax=Oldenlandia corymbosa var. corymbosa TaxID=529605 RepID=A0AAV1DF34_OLDCO|nr:OLC1v1005626C1 [Oldenlandia corymbosa var. corymbosa]